jgi:elongation factor 1-gamma
MSFGKLYTRGENHPRTIPLKAVAKANGLDVEYVDVPIPAPADYHKINSQGKIPSFEGADGYILSECIAIAIYLTSQNEKTTLLGKTKQDYASILKWLSFANQEVLPNLGNWFRPIKGLAPYNKKSVEDAQTAALKAVHVIEEHLLINTYLVGERFTLADLFTAALLQRGFEAFFDKKWRSENPNTVRWYETITAQSIFTAVSKAPSYVETAIENKPPPKAKEDKPKKEAAPKAAAAPKPKEPAADDDEDEAPPAPKPKHALEALGRPTFVLDEWKREYSNKETREEALPWFWEKANFEEFSLWRVDYKYNEELTQVFMTSNLIGGFFNRLEASRKYIFGAASVFGTSNNSIVRGAFYIRGQEALPAFDVAPDFESYEFTKLDPTKSEDKEFVNDMWAWDKPIEEGGKSYEWADGKVFK